MDAVKPDAVQDYVERAAASKIGGGRLVLVRSLFAQSAKWKGCT